MTQASKLPEHFLVYFISVVIVGLYTAMPSLIYAYFSPDQIKESIAYVLGPLILFLYFVSQSKKITPSKFSLFFLIATIYLSLSFLNLLNFQASHPFNGFVYLVKILISFFWVFAFMHVKKQNWEIVFLISTTLLACIAGYSLIKYSGTNNKGIVYPLGHISYFGDICALNLIFCGYLFTEYKKILPRIFVVCIFLIISTSLWLSATRSSFLGFTMAAVLFVFYLWQQHPHLKAKFLLIITAFISFIFIISILVSPLRNATITERFNLNNDDKIQLSSLSPGRVDGYKKTLKMVSQKPLLGWGTDSFRFAIAEFDTGPIQLQTSTRWYYHPHSEPLRQLVDNGPLSLLLWLSFFGLIFFYSIQLIFSQKIKDPLLLTGLLGLTVSVTSWQFSTTYDNPICRFLTLIFLSLAMRSILQHKNIFSISIPHKKKFSMAAGGLLIACIGVMSLHYLALHYAYRSYYSYDAQEASDDASKAYALPFKTFDPHYAFALTLLDQQWDSSKEKVIQDLGKFYPYTPSVLYVQGRYYLKKSNYKKAKVFTLRALEMDPHSKPFQRLLKDIEMALKAPQ